MMTREESKNQTMPSAHQIPLLSDNPPLRRAKTAKKARSSSGATRAAKITSSDPDYDPDSLDLFQEVFATLNPQSEQTPFIEQQVRQLADAYTAQIVRQLSQILVTDLTEIVDLLNPTPSPPKEPDL